MDPPVPPGLTGCAAAACGVACFAQSSRRAAPGGSARGSTTKAGSICRG